MKIANKISLSFLITAVILTSIAGTISYLTVKRNLENGIFSHLSTTARSRAHHIETFLETQKNAVTQLSESIVLEEFLSASKQSPDYTQKFDRAMRRLEATEKANEFTYELFVIDKTGKIAASSDRSKIGLDKSTDIYFLGARKGPCIKDTYHSETTGENYLAFSAPITDSKTAEFLGVIVARVNLDMLNEITTDKTGLGKTGGIYLVNKYGYMITPCRFIKDTFLKLKVDTENTRKCFEDIEKFDSKAHPHIPLTYRDYRGVKVLGIHDHIPQMKWGLLAEIDEKEALAPLAKIKLLFAIIIIFVPIAAWLMGIFVSRIISGPIHKLHIGTEIIGQGDMDYRVGTDAKDEIGQLSRAFDEMAGELKASHLKLKESHKQLEVKVQQRTAELTSANKMLEEEIIGRSLIQKALEERIKELKCLYGLSKLIEKQKIPLEQIFQEMPELIRKAYQYPDITCVRITFDGIQYKTDNFEKSEVSQYAPIEVHGEKAGAVEVYYLEEKPKCDEGPLLKEERDLLDALAERLGRITERKRAREKIKQQNEFLNNILESLTYPFYVIDADDYTIKMANSAAWTGKLPEKATCYMISHKRDKPCDGPDHICLLKEVKKTGKAVTVEHVHYGKDGNVKNMEVHGYPIFDSKGNVVQMIEYALDITERKQTEEALRASEHKHRTLLDNLPQKIFLKDRNSVYISCNDNYARDLKIKAKQIAGRTDYEFYPKELAEKYRKDDKRIVETGKTEDIEEKYIQAGRKVTVHTVKTPIKDEEGNVSGILGIFWDITERKKTEEALRESQKLFATFMGHLPGVAFMKDAEGRYLYMNEVCEKTYDVKSADWEGKTDDEIWPADIARNLKANDQIVMDEGEVLETVEELPQSDGIHHWLTYKFPLTDEHDKPVTLAGVAIDITQRMEVEKKLLQVQAAVDDATDAIIVTNCDGKAQYSNIAFGELFKHSSETINEAGIGSIFVDENVVKELSQTILGTDSWKGEVEMVSSMGRQFPAFLHGTPITDEQANILGMLFIINDITELKEAEREQAQLLAKVESTNKELKDFAHIVSHDLKAPLRGVSTLANWISTDYADKLGEEGKEQIDLLLTRVERMRKLIDGILQYSRAGRVKEKQVRVNLNELVPDVIDMVAPPGNIEITIEDELPVVECGQTRLIQVFQNLLSNAVKYMDKPQGQIKIGCVEEDGFWKFSVADNGPGIEEKHFERIFRIFQTLSPGDEFESTGVGLTVVKKIVELYGGKIWVESKLGEGSTFFFTLPKQKMGVKDAKLKANIVGRR